MARKTLKKSRSKSPQPVEAIQKSSRAPANGVVPNDPRPSPSMMAVYLLLVVILLLALKPVLSEVRQILRVRRDAARTAHSTTGMQ